MMAYTLRKIAGGQIQESKIIINAQQQELKFVIQKKTLNEWAEFSGIKPETLRYRISAGWEPTRAVFEKVTFNTEEHRRAALKTRKQNEQ